MINETISTILIAFLLLIFLGMIIFKKIKKTKERRNIFNFFKSRIEKIRKGENEFNNFLKFENGFFSNFQLQAWLRTYLPLFKEIEKVPFAKIGLPDIDETSIINFKSYNSDSLAIRLMYNNRFVKNELLFYNTFFDKIEGRKLDQQQRNAVIVEEDNTLVVAGAGSGKTTTIIGKIKYIIERYKVDPTNILLISFTTKSADTLAERIDTPGIEAKTFHKFGLDVLNEIEKRKISIYDENQFKKFIRDSFENLKKDEKFLKKLILFFSDYLKIEKPIKDFKNLGEYFQYLKDQNFKPYKQKEFKYNGITTYKREIVKSVEECKIANFLLFNGIDYNYEDPYEYKTDTINKRQYKPDFTINHNGKKIYLEHFALDKNGKVPKFFANEEVGESVEDASKKYLDGIDWKRKIHKRYSTQLLETYSHEMFEGILFKNLTLSLSKVGIQLHPKSPQEIWKIISDSANDEVDSIIKLFGTFITLMKSNNLSIEEVKEKNDKIIDTFLKKRNELFIDIVEIIFNRYENFLTERKEIDFNDMINKATKFIEDRKYNLKYSHIIVDEFQDISIGRYKLLKAIITCNPNSKLFAVGDDWQSIYRFTGSDIAIFKEFKDYFGYTYQSKIETTYRFNNPLLKVSSDFIQKNPNQTRKNLNSEGFLKSTDFKIIYNKQGIQNDSDSLILLFDELIKQKSDLTKKKILILGRYTFDINRLESKNSFMQVNYKNGTVNYKNQNVNGTEINITANFLTVHKAKGLEADIVIILNCNSGKYGFPSEMSDDKVLNLLLTDADQYENGEERRLFYVAMTRAKENLFIISESAQKSKFIAEMESNNATHSEKKCPICKTGILISKSGTSKDGKKWSFDGCSNYEYGCDEKKWK
jgi:DNA helicase-4